MACTLYSLSHTTLELERSSGDATGKELALLVEELLEEFGILVVDILDTASLETAIFLLLYVYRQGCEVTDFRCLCHDLVLLCFFGYCCGVFCAAATLVGILLSVLVETEDEEAKYALVATEGGLDLLDDGGIAVKLYERVEAGGLFLDGIASLRRPQISSLTMDAPLSVSTFSNFSTASFICWSDKTGVKMKTVS